MEDYLDDDALKSFSLETEKDHLGPNNPSGCTSPSKPDISQTGMIRQFVPLTIDDSHQIMTGVNPSGRKRARESSGKPESVSRKRKGVND